MVRRVQLAGHRLIRQLAVLHAITQVLVWSHSLPLGVGVCDYRQGDVWLWT